MEKIPTTHVIVIEIISLLFVQLVVVLYVTYDVLFMFKILRNKTQLKYLSESDLKSE